MSHPSPPLLPGEWKPFAQVPLLSPRIIAIVLCLGGVITALFRHWLVERGGEKISPPVYGTVIAAFWLLRATGLGKGIHVTGWWLSVLWHALFLLGSLPLLPFAFAFADNHSAWFLWPHFWLAVALILSVVGLQSEYRRRRADSAWAQIKGVDAKRGQS